MEELFNKLKIKIKDINLYNIAFSHSSYANEHKKKMDYERLEFLGDAVVDLVVADYFYSHDTNSEGELTNLRLGHGEEDNPSKAIIADIFEAFVGAIYLDLGYATARNIVLKVIVPYIEKGIIFFSDYKSALQEYIQPIGRSLSYNLVKEEGPSHKKIFTVEVVIDGIKYGTGVAHSKKEAEQLAAKEATSKLAL